MALGASALELVQQVLILIPMHRGKIALQRCPEPTHACTYTGSLYEMMQGVDAKRLEKELELEKKKLSCTTLATEIGLRCQVPLAVSIWNVFTGKSALHLLSALDLDGFCFA